MLAYKNTNHPKSIGTNGRKRRIKGVQLYFYEKKRLESLDTICPVTYQVLIVWNPRGSSHAKTSLLGTPPKQKSITTSWLLYQFAWWGSWQMVVETRECILFFLVLWGKWIIQQIVLFVPFSGMRQTRQPNTESREVYFTEYIDDRQRMTLQT